MAKRLRHIIGTQSNYRFTHSTVAFDGTKTPTDLTGAFVYFEVERDGVKLIDLDNDPAGVNTGVTITTPLSGIVDVVIPFGALPAGPGSDPGGDLYGLLVRIDPTGLDTRREPIRGLIDIVAELVDVP